MRSCDAGVLGDAVADLAQQLGDGRAGAGRDQQGAAVRPERDAAVDVAIADRVAQRGLAGVVGDLEGAGRVVLEDVGDLTAGRLRARRADRHVVRLRARRGQGEGDRDDRDHDCQHRDDAGRAQGGGGSWAGAA